MIRLLYASAFSISVFLPLFACANPVSTVYRVDFRPQDTIFEKGFTSLGGNTNYLGHLLDASTWLGTKDSAFISTTSSKKKAMEIYYRYRQGRNVAPTLYEIRATPNFYQSQATVYHWNDHVGIRTSDVTRAVMAEEQEWSAYKSIAGSQILSATILDDTNAPHTYRNPYYIELDTTASEKPFTLGIDEFDGSPVLEINPMKVSRYKKHLKKRRASREKQSNALSDPCN